MAALINLYRQNIDANAAVRDRSGQRNKSRWRPLTDQPTPGHTLSFAPTTAVVIYTITIRQNHETILLLLPGASVRLHACITRIHNIILNNNIYFNFLL